MSQTSNVSKKVVFGFSRWWAMSQYFALFAELRDNRIPSLCGAISLDFYYWLTSTQN